jgi:hypothetical protein
MWTLVRFQFTAHAKVSVLSDEDELLCVNQREDEVFGAG